MAENARVVICMALCHTRVRVRGLLDFNSYANTKRSDRENENLMRNVILYAFHSSFSLLCVCV